MSINNRLKLLMLLGISVVSLNLKAQFGALETGSASYYADHLDGNPTASGEVYNKNQLTCAHKIHPLGSILLVTRLDNGRSVSVRVNDRLSAKSDQVIILSRAAAEILGFVDAGTAMIAIEVTGHAGLPLAASSRDVPADYSYTGAIPPSYNLTPKTAARNENYSLAPKTPLPNSYENLTPQQRFTTLAERAPKFPPSYYQAVTTADRAINPTTPPSYSDLPSAYNTTVNTNLRSPEPGVIPARNYYIQTGAFQDYVNADRFYRRLLDRGISNANIFQAYQGQGITIYRTWIGPYTSEEIAEVQNRILSRDYKIRGVVVKEDKD